MADDEAVLDEGRAGPGGPRVLISSTAGSASGTVAKPQVPTDEPAAAAAPPTIAMAVVAGEPDAVATVEGPGPPPVAPSGQAPATGGRRSSKRAARVRARRVQRVIRRVDPWSVLKLSLVFFVCLDIVVIVAGVLLWSVAVSTDTIDNLESFIQELFALDRFQFDGRQIFRAAVGGSAVLVLAGTAATVVLTVLFNLISDLVGGVRVTVVEEEILVPGPATPPSSA